MGDLAGSSAFADEALLAALRERDVEYVDCFVYSCDDVVPYDEVLVNEAELLEPGDDSAQAAPRQEASAAGG